MSGKSIEHSTLGFLTMNPVEGDAFGVIDSSEFRNPETILKALEWRVNLVRAIYT